MFQDADLVKVLGAKFIPVAVDQHMHRQRKDKEGDIFARVLKQAGRGLDGYSQGVYLFTPDARLLAFANTADAAGVRRLTEIALKKFEAKDALPTGDAAEVKVFPPPPEGGAVLDVNVKVLGGYAPDDPKTKRYRESVGRDHLWLRKDEVEALSRGSLPESVLRRIVRYHLVDNTRGEPPMWRDDEVKKLDVVLRAGRISGTIHVETRSKDRGYEAELAGVMESREGRLMRLDLVAKGMSWGEGSFTRGAPPGRYPLAVAFRIAGGDCAIDRVPPQGARGNVKAYLR